MPRVGLFGQISDINDHLYLSGAGVLKPEKLKQKKITCVINATTEEPNACLPGVECLKIRIEDHPNAKLNAYFDMVADKIKSIKDHGGKTLVHCVAGVSRSASLCIIYLLKYEKMSLRQAYHYVKSARPIIRPNVGFWKQMVEYEKKLRGHSTITLIPVANYPHPFPDVYSNDLRKHIISFPEAAHTESQMIAVNHKQQAKNGSFQIKGRSTYLPIEYNKRRGISAGTTIDAFRNRHFSYSGTGLNNTESSPWRNAPSYSLLSPMPNRRSTPRQPTNIFGNIYNSSREAFFPAF